jgi:hypothetical protein
MPGRCKHVACHAIPPASSQTSLRSRAPASQASHVAVTGLCACCSMTHTLPWPGLCPLCAGDAGRHHLLGALHPIPSLWREHFAET